MNYLIIGYGNTLRSDDGAGQRVAEAVAQWNWHDEESPGGQSVKALAVQQLTPELAVEIAQAGTVIFVDAIALAQEMPPEVQIQPIAAGTGSYHWGHSSDPQSLLDLTQALYGQAPQAYWILIPAVNFELGEQYSPVTATGITTALAKIKQLLSCTF
jgi:hydrogenase maturation protease